MPESNLEVAEILRAPFSRVVLPDRDTGTFTARILEFSGCVAQGDTVEEAYARLESAAEAWLEAALALGQSIPTPVEDQSYSGRVLVRLPRSLHRQAVEAARGDATSLNQFIVTAVAVRVGERGETDAEAAAQRVRIIAT
jgi:predicted RNase H-like HicB family nuclease